MRNDLKGEVTATRLGLAALILISAGWIVAVLLGDGFELHRSALAMPFVVAGGLCGLVDTLRTGRAIWMPALVAGSLAMFYFAARAILSPVWDLGRHDSHLVALGWITIATVAGCAGTPRRAGFLLGTITLVFLAHLGAGLYQRFVDPEWVLLRLPRRTGGGVSGMFWHWNNLAALLAIALPLFLGVVFTVRRPGVRILVLALVVAGLGLAYFTQSRAGIAAVVIGLVSVGVVVLLWRAQGWRWSARLAIFSAVGVAGVAAAIAVVLVVSRVSAQRGHGADLDQALGESLRLPLAGMAVDLWLERIAVGHGSQSFRYLAVKNWDDETLPVWLGNPETVHNEYLQVLADYGLLGLVLVMAFLLLALGRVVIAPKSGPPSPLGRGLQLGAAGGLVGAMVHATAEFQLHLLPILLLAAVAIGVLLQPAGRSALPARGLQGFSVLVAVVLAVVAVGRENLMAPKWLAWQGEVLRTGGRLEASKLADLKALVQASPHYEAALRYGRLCYDEHLQNPESERAGEWLEEALWGLEIAYRRNRFDPTTLVTYAVVLDQAGRHEEATPVHVRAVEMAARRENKYGAMAGLAMNLYHRGEQLWMKRQAEVALGYFLHAQRYLETSHARLFKFGGSRDFSERRRLLESRITLLQNAGIQPQSPPDVPPLREDL